MNVTELAHWRYQLKRLNQWPSRSHWPYKVPPEVEWLTEEAKYMCELGELTL